MVLKNNKGFTLIELLIVMAILGILSSIAIPSFLGHRTKAKVASIEMLLGEVATLEREYYARNGTFIPCSENPSVANSGWTETPEWEALGFRPMQPLYGYKLKVEVNGDGFKAIAINHNGGIMSLSNRSYSIQGE